MSLGAFSISLSVKDIEQSKVFYENIGFEIFAGDQSQNWLIMKQGDHCVGLFQGMFENNLMTFNPGWDKDCNELKSFTDIRQLRDQFKQQGIKIERDAIEKKTGPGSFTLVDPDGNKILFDQHL